MANFFTPEELASWLQQDLDLSTATLLAALASGSVREELGQVLDAVTNETITVVGRGVAVLFLPELPVTGVSAVSVAGTALTTGEIEWRRNGELRWQLTEPSTTSSACYRRWPDGADIQVTYSHGYALVPQAVKSVALELAAGAYANPTSVASESVGGYSVSYAQGSLPGRIGLTGDQRRRLDPFRPPVA